MKYGRTSMRFTRWPAALLVLGALSHARAGPGGWEPDRRLTRSSAAAMTSINFARNVAADGCGRVQLVWFENLGGNTEIFTKRSADAGSSWGPALRLTNAPGDSHYPSIAVAGDAVHVVWWDTRAGVPQIFYKRSGDGGLTWSADAPITNSPAPAAYPSVAVWGGSVHVVYVGGDAQSSEVYYVRSLDDGQTWQPPRRLSDLPDNSWVPTVAVSGPNVYVAWSDTRHGGSQVSLEEEYFVRSTDGGATWGPNVRLTFDPPGQPANSWAPSLTAAGAFVWLVWFDERDGNFEIYTKRSTDFGVTWSADQRLTFDSAASARPSVAQVGTSVHVVWFDHRDNGGPEIYTKRSDDLGATWGPDTRLSFATGESAYATVAAAATGVFAVWQDGRDGPTEIYSARLPGAPIVVGNGRIAFTRMVAGKPQIFTAAPDGTDVRQLTALGANHFPAWSRDGARIAFASNPTYPTGPFEIWMMDADGSNQVPLTSGTPGTNFVPDWSYDGTRIAFASARPPAVPHPEVWVMNADGTEQTRLTITPPNGQFTWSLHPSWAPDDARIYYASTASGSSQIWGMFANGAGQHQKTNGLGPGYPNANVPEFSREGSRLVFWSGIEGQYGEVWTMHWSGGDFHRVTDTPDPHNSDNPAWAPDGTKLLFDSGQPSPSGGVNVWFITPGGSNQSLLIPGAFGQTSWQPVFTCPVCYPDCNADGSLSVADFGCFQTRFVAGDPYADCNGAGGQTVADFVCFQTRFVAGCP